MVFFNTKEFQKFIEKNNVSKIIIPNDYVEAKKLFLNNLKKNFKNKDNRIRGWNKNINNKAL